ncbi:MAG: MBL fold metallo-hydrolase [Propionibacteriaceae bacterium]|nr:MBL fold metallo-hydrolase [Propionibacteriaceae bacterium]
MKELSSRVLQCDRARGANAYVVRGRRGLVLIDPGLTSNVTRIARAMVQAGMSPYHVTEVLLTHYDPDHAASADEWVRRTGARLWIGAADAAIMRRETPVPRTPFRRLTARFAPGLASPAELLNTETEIAEGFRAVPTPGHTPGHTAFLHDGFAFIGDAALVGVDGALNRMPTFLDADPHQADATRARLREWEVGWFCCGHSAPVRVGRGPRVAHR